MKADLAKVYAILIGVGLYFSNNCETELSQAARYPRRIIDPTVEMKQRNIRDGIVRARDIDDSLTISHGGLPNVSAFIDLPFLPT
jgi:hypothetical protein